MEMNRYARVKLGVWEWDSGVTCNGEIRGVCFLLLGIGGLRKFENLTVQLYTYVVHTVMFYNQACQLLLGAWPDSI